MSDFLNNILSRLADAVRDVTTTPGVERFVAARTDMHVHKIVPRSLAPGRRHVFADVPSFAAFVRKHMPDGNVVEVLADTEKITAINAASWSRDEVGCILAKHPDFLGWERLVGVPMKQKALFRELIARQHTLVGEEGVIPAIQRLDLSSASEATYSLTPNGNYDVVAKKQTTSSTTKIPATFTVSVPVYLDTAPRSLQIALLIESVPTDGAEPTFSLRAINLDTVKLNAYRDEVERLRSLLGTAYLVGAGRLALEA